MARTTYFINAFMIKNYPILCKIHVIVSKCNNQGNSRSLPTMSSSVQMSMTLEELQRSGREQRALEKRRERWERDRGGEEE